MTDPAGVAVDADPDATRRAAEAGNAEAGNALGEVLLATDDVQAAGWFRRAAEAGSAPGANNLARLLNAGRGVPQDRAEALRWFKVAAEKGIAAALGMVGLYYYQGWGGLAEDAAQAAAWFRRAAEAGSGPAAMNLAILRDAGRGVPQDRAEALRWYKVAAEKGNAAALDMLGRYHREGWGGLAKDAAQAAAWFRRAAEAGSAPGANNLANLLHVGDGVSQDRAEALRWYEVAAEKGDADALNVVGRYHREGWGGLAKDAAQAAVWFRQAAEAGSTSGANNLAELLYAGRGVPQDRAEALRWYKVAAEKGDAAALNTVGRYHQEGWGGLAKDAAQAAAWFRQAAEAGSTSGAYNLANLLHAGRGVPQDRAEALRWFKVAAEKGHADALNTVGRYHHEGSGGLAKDAAQAAAWFRRAAEAGSAFGANNLAELLHAGRGVPQDRAEALRWYKVAAEKGDAAALNTVGRYHQEGWGGLGKDGAQAAAWFRQAIERESAAAIGNLGFLLVNGAPGLAVDTESAAYWLRRAMEAGDGSATAFLAHLHEQGLPGVAPSKAEARRLFRIAADKGVTWAHDRWKALSAQTLPAEPEPPSIVAYDRRFVELDALRGLATVKQTLRELAGRMDVGRRRKALGYRAPMPNAHMLFLGNPGTGKTTVARIVGRILASVGVLPSGHVVEVERTNLVQVYIGETEKKTAEYIERAMGGVLFVDEAYALVPEDSPRDHGPRALDTILTAMENHLGKFVVIFAGYEREMGRVLAYNPGLPGRIGARIVFPDYGAEELLRIALDQIRGPQGFGYEGAVEGKLRALIEDRFVPPPENFANARSVRNLVEEIVGRHANRRGARLDQIGVVDITDPRPVAKKRAPLEELQGMIGLATVKREVDNWSAQLRMATRRHAQLRQGQGAAERPRPGHIIFAGSPGTGKTVVAGLVARILVENGMLTHDRVHAVTRADLVGQYLGQTAPRVEKAFRAAEGGVLFIDEAYALSRDPRDTFGQEAIDTMVPLIENLRGTVLVILAGYTREMDGFLHANPGLRSRFPTRVHFDDYTPAELLLIFEKFCFDRHFHLTPDARRKVASVLATCAATLDFGNARGVRNLVDKTLANLDMRLERLNDASDLFQIEAVDIAS